LTADSYVLINNEFETARKCQKMQYCVSAVMEREEDGKINYVCKDCVNSEVDSDFKPIADKYIARLI